MNANDLQTLIDSLDFRLDGVRFSGEIRSDEDEDLAITASFLIEEGSEADEATDTSDVDNEGKALAVFEEIGAVLCDAFEAAGMRLTDSGGEGPTSFGGTTYSGGEYHHYALASK